MPDDSNVLGFELKLGLPNNLFLSIPKRFSVAELRQVIKALALCDGTYSYGRQFSRAFVAQPEVDSWIR